MPIGEVKLRANSQSTNNKEYKSKQRVFHS